MTVTETQLIDWLERSISVVSIIGCLFIILTFSFFPEFRKPMNRLIFYASFGNICSNIATSIATSGLPERGASMGLCRLQGFFIQMFMTADVVWAMFMALNVFLAFRGYTSQELLNLEVCYNVVAYGVPSIPAIIYLILDLTMDTGIYGPATLWCWVSDDYEWLRVGFFYGPALYV
ncbi:hypothetical protein K490DRAFT_50481 [Saccharata proteae CBS 121410]|uniref:G-protein coupled receptors family 2 profile 2 domain-containing protein n=1 Tax=Saccharata proteae CBS 121410 TaxID=1314787 RepID=A0A9P4LU93_9PEZI|nr:hypothetical protein K490DRAFT_50481 [Saccharata proteae CBS 121410]